MGPASVGSSPLLAFFGLFLILPAMALAFVLGFRTYRVEGYLGRRVGIGIGAIVGWTCFFALCWLSVAYGLGEQDQLFRPTLFAGLSNSLLLYVFPLPALVATVLVFYALYATRADFGRRRTLTLVAAGLVALAGLGIVVADPDPLGIVGRADLDGGGRGRWLGVGCGLRAGRRRRYDPAGRHDPTPRAAREARPGTE